MYSLKEDMYGSKDDKYGAKDDRYGSKDGGGSRYGPDRGGEHPGGRIQDGGSCGGPGGDRHTRAPYDRRRADAFTRILLQRLKEKEGFCIRLSFQVTEDGLF